jgi:succinate-semialdehyde dehydrogenase/glutarate-semialdehyde dehydrogenase
MTIKTINPATETIIATYETLTKPQADALIDAGKQAFLQWRQTSFLTRKHYMLTLSALLRQQRLLLATLITQEMGKPIKQAQLEIEKCAWVCEHYALEAQTYLTPRMIATDNSKTTVSYHPLGIIFAIMPWNFPFWQVFRFAIPCIMAGNAVIIKHASVSLGTGNAIAKLVTEAGFDKHLCQHAILDNTGVENMIAHPNIAAVSFTGSDTVGRIIASQAGAHLKKSVLELGGSDPYIVLRDADICLASRCIVSSRLTNSGQVCIAAKRIIAVDAIHDQLVEAIITAMADYHMADPMDELTKLGPMARRDLRDRLHQQVIDSVKEGANLVIGGFIPLSTGFYYPATLLTQVAVGMAAFDEELFGPVIAVIRADNEQHAIALANHSKFGLGAAVFTQDIARGEQIATEQIEAGSCFVNTLVVSDPRLPFGGIKDSGFGRELSQEGIHEFVYVKTVAIK